MITNHIEERICWYTPIHEYAKAPAFYCMQRVIKNLSPDLGYENYSIPKKILQTARSVAELAVVIPVGIGTAFLAMGSFVIKKGALLLSTKELAPFAKLYDAPEGWQTFEEDSDEEDSERDLSSLERIGFSTSDYQLRGPNVPQDNPKLYGPLENNPDQDSQWAAFDQEMLDETIKNYVSYSQWEDLDAYIKTLQEVGVNSLRLSPPESLYPNKDGEFNDAAIGRFKEILEALNKAGISIHFTLFHFTYPKYIEDSGGYLNEQNIDTFVKYSERMFQEFHTNVTAWCTINEPAVFAMQKYFRAVHANGEMNFQKMAQLMINFIKMHNRTYQALKQLDGGEDAIIGFSHDVIHFKPHNTWNPIDQFVCWFFTNIFHKAYLEFYRSGHFEIAIPIPTILSTILSFVGITLPQGVLASYDDPDFEENNKYLDRIFLQTYGIPEIATFQAMRTGLPYQNPDLYNLSWGCPADPWAIYHGTREMYEVTGKEIEITETGCPIPMVIEDGDNFDYHRGRQAEFIRRAFLSMSQVMQDGYPLKAAYVWSFVGSQDGEREGRWWEWEHLDNGINFGTVSPNKNERGTYKLYPAAKVVQSVAKECFKQEKAA